MKFNIDNLTLQEKLTLLCGKTSWLLENANGKLKEVTMNDGPNGLRKVVDEKNQPATSMPSLSVLANTFNREYAKLDGETIADECIENGVDILLAPGVNIKRTPLNGRNFEYFSEDPLLSGELAKNFIEGVQNKGVGTSLKHFCMNNREIDRLYQSSEIDERAMREIYLPAFEIALQAKPWMVMSSYNLVNGEYASESKWLLKDILRGEFGYDGVIVSDWGAIRRHRKALQASLDLAMPHHPNSYHELLKAYEDGLITIEQINSAVTRLVELIEKTDNDKKKVSYTKQERHDVARKIAEEGIVLLKNQGALPINSGKTVVNYPKNPHIGGTGAAEVNTLFIQPHLADLLTQKLKGKAEFVKNNALISPTSFNNVRSLYENAYESDAVILAVSDNQEGESSDRTQIRLSPYIEDIILQTAKYNKNVIVLVMSGSAIDMSRWIDQVNAVLYCGYAGEGLTEALANIISGEVSPSGKLAETIPMTLEETYTETLHGNGHVDWYDDGLFVGYRYYDSYESQVLYPFGYGLSYAKFTYSNLKIKKNSELDYIISYDITNESDFDAKECSQLYVKDVFSMVIRPEKELKGFSKDLIKAGQTKTISIQLNKRSFAFYSIPKKDWYVENGAFEILVGSSSRDIKLSAKITIELDKEEQLSY